MLFPPTLLLMGCIASLRLPIEPPPLVLARQQGDLDEMADSPARRWLENCPDYRKSHMSGLWVYDEASRVLIAHFVDGGDETGGGEEMAVAVNDQLTAYLSGILPADLVGEVEHRVLPCPIESEADARMVGAGLEADIVIWGRFYSRRVAELELTGQPAIVITDTEINAGNDVNISTTIDADLSERYSFEAHALLPRFAGSSGAQSQDLGQVYYSNAEAIFVDMELSGLLGGDPAALFDLLLGIHHARLAVRDPGLHTLALSYFERAAAGAAIESDDAQLLAMLAAGLQWLHKDDEALALVEQAWSAESTASWSEDLRCELAAMGALAAVGLDPTDTRYQSALETCSRGFAADPTRRALAQHALGTVQYWAGDTREAGRNLQKARGALDGAIREQLRADDLAPDYGLTLFELAHTLNNLGAVYLARHRMLRAWFAYDRLADATEALVGANSPWTGIALFNQGKIRNALLLTRRAEALLLQARQIFSTSLGENDLYVAYTYREMGHVRRFQHRKEDALQEYKQALQMVQATVGDDHLEAAVLHHSMGLVYQSLDRDEEAINAFCAAYSGYQQHGYSAADSVKKKLERACDADDEAGLQACCPETL